MASRCKFQCASVTKRVGTYWDSATKQTVSGFVYDAEFYAVSGTSGENEKFFASTPTGNLKVQTVREDHFVPGKPYYLDLIEAAS